MPGADDQFQIVCDQSIDSQRLAAGIWARATARRDALAEVATIDEKLPGIQSSLRRDGASLHVASGRGDALGFLLAVPRVRSLEVLYLAVDPGTWGGGVGTCLLRHLDDYASSMEFGELELWVITDNDRAVALYERSGWRATDEVKVRNSGGRLERRFVRQCGPPGPVDQ